MKYPKWRPLIVRLAEKTFKWYRDAVKRNERTAVEALAFAVGTEKEVVQQMIDTRDLSTAARMALSTCDIPPGSGTAYSNCVKSQSKLLDEGNPRIFIEDLSILRALCRSKATSMPSHITARFHQFTVFVPSGYEVDGISVQPFFVGVHEADGARMVTMEIATGNAATQVMTMPWHIFIRSILKKSSIRDLPSDFQITRKETHEWNMYFRLAAALCLHMASDDDCLEEGFPPSMNRKDVVWGSRDFRIAKVRAFRFAPKFANKADRAACDVMGHWAYLVDPFFHHGEVGKCRAIYKRAHSRGKDKVTPYTLIRGPVVPLRAKRMAR